MARDADVGYKITILRSINEVNYMSSTSSNEYNKRDLNLDIGFERFEEDFYADVDTLFIKTNVINDTNSLLDTSLTYSKTPEEEFEEQRKASLAESYLESIGIKVRTDMYGFYRHTYDILIDLGEYLSKKSK